MPYRSTYSVHIPVVYRTCISPKCTSWGPERIAGQRQNPVAPSCAAKSSMGTSLHKIQGRHEPLPHSPVGYNPAGRRRSMENVYKGVSLARRNERAFRPGQMLHRFVSGVVSAGEPNFRPMCVASLAAPLRRGDGRCHPSWVRAAAQAHRHWHAPAIDAG